MSFWVYWILTISDLLCNRQKRHLHLLQLVSSCLCYQCTKWSYVAIRGNRAKTCPVLRLSVTLLLLCPTHMMIMWYHQIVKRMRCDCRASKQMCHLLNSLQPQCLTYAMSDRCLGYRSLTAFLFQSYAWWWLIIKVYVIEVLFNLYRISHCWDSWLKNP